MARLTMDLDKLAERLAAFYVANNWQWAGPGDVHYVPSAAQIPSIASLPMVRSVGDGK